MSSEEKLKILHLEDDQDWVNRVRSYLEDLYDVTTIDSHVEALDLIAKEPFALVIVDISLVLADPRDEQGFTFAKQVRETEKIYRQAGSDVSTAKMIVLTGYPWRERFRTAFRDYQVSDFIDKAKVSRKTLRKAVKDALEEDKHL